MTTKPSYIAPRTPSGVMELLPREQIAFQAFMDKIRKGYERFGFLPVETPVFELSSVLLTKEGGETEKQVYFVQSTGALKQGDVPEMALRFDLTVPLARYVAEHEHELNFPFRRYQMQKVYRGERAQRGRQREFYQCDIDVIGKDELSINFDAELPAIIHGIFSDLGIGRFQIQINNRRLLKSLLSAFGVEETEKQANALREIDKLDKIGADKVLERLLLPDCGLDAVQAKNLLTLMGTKRSNDETLRLLRDMNNSLDGLADLKTVYEGAKALGVPEEALNISLTTVRGLDYYTGTVYETLLLDDPKLGSICSGGRYDNLAGHYTRSKLPGVGISIGATRLFEYMLETKRITLDDTGMADVLVLQVDTALLPDYFRLAAQLRAAGLKVEVYVDPHKLGKQLKYADRSGVALALLMGPDEQARGTVTLKHLKTSQQEEVALADIAAKLLGLRAA
jgi:histidyl-tRNA synthetase